MFFFPITPKGRARRKVAQTLYANCVQRGREAVFYAGLSVPDTFTGRFEMISLHVGLVINRLRSEGKAGHLQAQALFDEMFLNMELACRQVGIGDLGVPKQIKKMMKALQGRSLHYEEAITQGLDAVIEALKKNLYATTETPSPEILRIMAKYVTACRENLKVQQFETLARGELSFPPLPDVSGVSNDEISKVA